MTGLPLILPSGTVFSLKSSSVTGTNVSTVVVQVQLTALIKQSILLPFKQVSCKGGLKARGSSIDFNR